MGFVIRLNESEQILAGLLAQRRYYSNRQGRVRNDRRGGQSDEVTDLNGVGGEIAFARYAGLYPDLDISPRKGGIDFLTPNGSTVNVKTTPHPNGNLICKPGTDPVDVFVLVVGVMPEYEIVGWAYGHELLNERTLTDLGYGPTHLLAREDLRPIPETPRIDGVRGPGAGTKPLRGVLGDPGVRGVLEERRA